MSDAVNTNEGSMNFPTFARVPETRLVPLTLENRPDTKLCQLATTFGLDLRNQGLPYDQSAADTLADGGRFGFLLRGAFVAFDADVKHREALAVGEDGVGRFVDLRHGRDDIEKVFERAGVEIPVTTEIRTKSGGTHLVFRQNPEAPYLRDVIDAAGYEGLDLLGDRVRYLAWGGGYEVVCDAPAAVLPIEVARLLSEARPKGKSGRSGGGAGGGGTAHSGPETSLEDTSYYITHGLPSGAHDHTLTRLAARFAADGMSDDKGVQLLRMIIASTAIDHARGGWPDGDLLRKMASGREFVSRSREAKNPQVRNFCESTSFSSPLTPGQDSQKFSTCDDVPEGPPEGVLTDPEKLARKLRAEQNTDPLSLDWADAPEGELDENGAVVRHSARAVYEQTIVRLMRGTELTEAWLHYMDPTQAARDWLTSRDHPLLMIVGGKVYALPDPPREPSKDLYPGWEQSLDPRSGSNWVQERRSGPKEAVLVYVAAHPDEALSDRMIATWLNSTKVRVRFGFDDLRAATPGHVARLRNELYAEGRLHMTRAPRNYRKGHTWATLSASYAVGTAPMGLVHAQRALAIRKQIDRHGSDPVMEAVMASWLGELRTGETGRADG